jgi:Family of unknown function (DUF5994)
VKSSHSPPAALPDGDRARAQHRSTTIAAETAARVPLRLLLSAPSDASRLDGAWWPQSHDLAIEFADLAENLPDRFGRIVNIAHSKSGWDPSPTWLPGGRGRLVRARTFLGTADPERVLLRLENHRSLDIMVVPPEFDAESADGAMRAAASSANRLSALALLDEAVAERPDASRSDDDAGAQAARLAESRRA